MSSPKFLSLPNDKHAPGVVLVDPATGQSALSDGRVQTVDAAYEPVGGKMLIGTARDKFRDGFFTLDTEKNWDVVQQGADQAVGVDGVLNGSRYLKISSGTTAGAETILLSKQSFKLPVKLAVGLSMSQRIANNSAFVELVGVDPVTGLVETDATYPGPSANAATNATGLLFDATTVTAAKYFTRGFGVSELLSAASTFLTTLATGVTPNFMPASIYEINADMEEVVFSSKLVDSVAAMALPGKRTQNIPDPGKEYKIRIRVLNGVVAPASNTDVRIHFVRILDTTRVTVDLARHVGRATDVASSIPVVVTQGVSATLTASNSAVGLVGPQAPATAPIINSLASTNSQLVLIGTSGLQSLYATNVGATPAFVKLYNKATAPVVGTDIPAMIIPVPAAVGGVPGVAQISPGFSGYRFALGLGLAITGSVEDADATPVAAGQVKLMLSRTV